MKSRPPAERFQAQLDQGLQHHRAGRLAEATACYSVLLTQQPRHPDLLYLSGLAAQQSGKLEFALRQVDAALRANPSHAGAHLVRGLVLKQRGKAAEAIASYNRAAALQPENPEIYYLRGNARLELNAFSEAIADFDRALSLRPAYAEALNNRGNAFRELTRYESALDSYHKALELRPDYLEALSNYGQTLRDLQRPADALAFINNALNRFPQSAALHNNRGIALQDLGKVDDALQSFLAAQRLEPDLAMAHFNEGACRLLIGDFEGGWPKYEWRWRVRSFRPVIRNFPVPQWEGNTPLSGKTILLHAEQGLGDTLQFCRFLEPVAKLGATVLLEAQPALHAILRGLPGVARVFSPGDPLPPFDCHCPLASLPFAFDTSLASLAESNVYLFSEPTRVALWRERLGPARKKRIGLVWSGSLIPNPNRSVPLALLQPLWSADFEFVSLQKEIRPGDEPALPASPLLDFRHEIKDFADTAALVELCDLVISVDTSAAHLAGAMGRPVWILLMFNPDWRWLLEREDSPWYPSARLFRQTQPGDWESVVAQIARELPRFFAHGTHG